MNYINSCWLNDLVHLLRKYGVEIKLRNTSLSNIQRENDVFIIDNVLTNLSPITTLKNIHVCRLYLQVTSLLDITNLKGNFILPNSLQGIRAQHRNSKYDCTFQQRSNSHSWKLWNKMIRSIYRTSSSNHLKQSFHLKRWIKCTMVQHIYHYSPI